ncbi:MAG: glycosyltransferase [Candidatus Omnitrophota bacterium]
MKMIQIVPRMDLGGVETGVLDLAKYYKDKEDEIIVVSGGGRMVKELQALGVKHYTLDVYSKSLAILLRIRNLRSIIDKEDVDIVHARSRVPAWISFFATRNSEVDFITTAHGFYSVHLLSRVMAWGKFVICPSGVVARHMEDKFGVPADKIRVINRWVDLDRYKFVPYKERPSGISIVSVGRISPSKGYEYVIEAMRHVVRLYPDVKLKIAGSAETAKERYFSHLKNLVTKYSLDHHVRFSGYQPDINKLLSRSHMLVFPSVVPESFGRVIIEAFACGVPVIAAKVGAVSEIIEDGKDGVLVPPGDVGSLSRAILELIKDRPLTERLIRHARLKVESKYSFVSNIAETKKVYKVAKEFKRILVVKISSFGDLILSIPSLAAVKKHFPASEITLLTLERYVPLFSQCPYLDKVVGVDKGYKRLSHIRKIAVKLRRASYDYIIDFQNSRVSHILTFLAFARKSFGYARKLGFLLTNRAELSQEPVGPLASQEKILNLLGLSLDEKKLSFWPVKEFSSLSFTAVLAKECIGINVSASPKWQTKNWPPSQTKRFIKLFIESFPSFKIVLIGDSSAKKAAAILESSFNGSIVNLCGKTSLSDLAAILKSFAVFISQDTATMHLAYSLKVETVGLFGPTDPARHVVECDNLHIIHKKTACSFCYKNRCRRLDCMKNITPEEVCRKVKEIITKNLFKGRS